MKFYLYEIKRPKETSDLRKYIGVSSNPKRRFKEHKKSDYFVGHFIRKYSDAYLDIINQYETWEEALEVEKLLVPNDPGLRNQFHLLNETGGGNIPPIQYGNKNAVGAIITEVERFRRSNRMKEIAKNRDKEYYKRCYESQKRNALLGLTNRKYKTYIFVNPQGVNIEIQNLKKFCKENKLNYPSMIEVYKKIRKIHKGWTV